MNEDKNWDDIKNKLIKNVKMKCGRPQKIIQDIRITRIN